MGVCEGGLWNGGMSNPGGGATGAEGCSGGGLNREANRVLVWGFVAAVGSVAILASLNLAKNLSMESSASTSTNCLVALCDFELAGSGEEGL
jgi:hypothetical protein